MRYDVRASSTTCRESVIPRTLDLFRLRMCTGIGILRGLMCGLMRGLFRATLLLGLDIGFEHR